MSITDSKQHNAATDEFVRAVAGDPAGFAAFLARFEGRIVRTIRALVATGEVEDVFQEVCLRLISKGHLYDPTRPLIPWLDAVTRQVCASAWRRDAKRRGDRSADQPDFEEVAAPDLPPGEPWVREAVHGYLDGLLPKERAALGLVLLNGLTQREAAKRLDVPPGTIATWMARGVRAVRAKLGELNDVR